MGKVVSRLGSTVGNFAEGAGLATSGAADVESASRGGEGFDSRPQANEINATHEIESRLTDICQPDYGGRRGQVNQEWLLGRGLVVAGLELRRIGIYALHGIAQARQEELTWTAVELGLKRSVALRIRTKPRVAGGSHELRLARVDETNEVQELQPHAITHERDTHVAMKVATHFSGLSAKALGQASERQIRPAA